MAHRNSLFAAFALCALPLPALAQVSSTVTLTSDYDFRGISQTARDPALQASLDWAGASGAYLGAWASNVDFGRGTDASVELDLLGGYRGKFNDEATFDIGAVYYSFWGDGDDVPFGEIYAGIGYKMLSAKLWYAPDFSNSGETATYLEANATFPLPNDFGLAIHAGYSDGDYWDAVNGGGYLDYSLGLTKSVGKFSLALKWVDGSDLKSSDGTPGDVFTSESKVMLSVATTLPWGK